MTDLQKHYLAARKGGQTGHYKALRTVAESDAEVTAERTRLLKEITVSLRGIDKDLRALRTPDQVPAA